MLGKIVIHTDADFTPAGKRSAKIVETRGPMGKTSQLRWYVSNRRFRSMRPTEENIRLTREWLNA